MNKRLKNKNGITLVALVITIIILLILAGISISVLTNQGLFAKAQEAKKRTENAQKEESEILENYLEQIETITGGEKTALENAETAKPAGARITVTDASKGIVMVDSKNNEWVWVEVPKTTVFTTATKSDEYEKIKTNLISYASDYREGKEGQGRYWTDEWYDKYGTTYDGENQYSQVKYIDSSSNFTTAKAYYGTIYTDTQGTAAESYSSGTTYYADIRAKLTDRSGCGLTYDEYQTAYNKMLSSIYTKGGFWISRFEAGIKGSDTDTTKARLSHPDDVITDETISTFPEAVSQANMIPYNYVYCSEAQALAKKMSTDTTKTSSLLFGIQWDLTCKFLQEKGGLSVAQIKGGDDIGSTNWGNYKNSSLTLNRGKYNINPRSSTSIWTSFDVNTTNYVTNKQTSSNTSYSQLLTTGASENTKKMNIYDFAGNEWEWILEHATYDMRVPCARRGGDYSTDGYSYPASNRFDAYYTTTSSVYVGFRSALY